MNKNKDKGISLTQPEYAELVDDLRLLLDEGRERAQQAVGAELVRTYHAMGQRIIAARLSERSGYGSAMYERLGTELGLHPRVLRQTVDFAEAYRKVPAVDSLRWAHYRELLRAPSAEARRWYEAETRARGWTARKLGASIRAQGHEADARATKGSKKPVRKLRRPSEPRFVYKAEVLRVVDGDTLLARVDLGFDVQSTQRLRLAGIDTPAAGKPGADEATRFVGDRLALVDFVVIQTNKLDIYGRYVAHLFYAPDEKQSAVVFSKGRYLNQELLDAGMAAPL